MLELTKPFKNYSAIKQTNHEEGLSVQANTRFTFGINLIQKPKGNTPDNKIN